MEVKCNFNPNYSKFSHIPPKPQGIQFYGKPMNAIEELTRSADIFVKRPVAVENATGLLSIRQITKNIISKIKNYAKNYVKNINHTFEHKMVFALIEKEIFGKNSIDSITHDADKLILYTLGFPKSFVSDFHRKHSMHHPESGKKMNLKSMLCDNIASSPEFKPEKKRSLREHYHTYKPLQDVEGFGEILEKYNYGENLDFEKIKKQRDKKLSQLGNLAIFSLESLGIIFPFI